MGSPDSFGLLGAWLELLHANDVAETTTRAYVYGVWNLLFFHGFKVPLDQIDEGHIAAFLASLGNRSTSKEQYAKGLRSFFDWAHRDDGVPPHVVGAIVGHSSLATTSAYAAIGNRRTTRDAVAVFGSALRAGADEPMMGR
jgi:site-specific recombinase XerD